MNYYPHHIGDFDRATRHLTRIERSVYRDLIELYYDTEKPLILDRPKLCRRIIALEDVERAAVDQVLTEFFTETPDGWYHERCEAEIAEYLLRGEDNEERKKNEAERQRRHRERRKELFAQLRDRNIVPKYDTPTADLESMLRNAPVTRDKSVQDGDVQEHTSQATAKPVTSNQEPITNNQWGESAREAVPVDNSPPPISLEFQEVLKARPELPDPGATYLNFWNHYPADKRTIGRWRKWVADEHTPKLNGHTAPQPVTAPSRTTPEERERAAELLRQAETQATVRGPTEQERAMLASVGKPISPFKSAFAAATGRNLAQ